MPVLGSYEPTLPSGNVTDIVPGGSMGVGAGPISKGVVIGPVSIGGSMGVVIGEIPPGLVIGPVSIGGSMGVGAGPIPPGLVIGPVTGGSTGVVTGAVAPGVVEPVIALCVPNATVAPLESVTETGLPLLLVVMVLPSSYLYVVVPLLLPIICAPAPIAPPSAASEAKFFAVMGCPVAKFTTVVAATFVAAPFTAPANKLSPGLGNAEPTPPATPPPINELLPEALLQ